MKYTAKNMYKSCFKKARFRDYNKALRVASKYNQRVYYCPICGAYHLTSQVEKRDGRSK